MNVLAVNCGSSTLKFRVIETDGERQLARGTVERIGGEATFRASSGDGAVEERAAVDGHGGAMRRVLRWLEQTGLTAEAVGHRVVHGGERFVEPTLLDDAAIAAIESLTELAPLHNAPALAAIRATHDTVGRSTPMVATFDTSFHRTMPQRAARYAVPPDLADRHGAVRYGFHGLAHRWMTERYLELTGSPAEGSRLITLQLGNGCSAAAIAGGHSVDTSMGLTPLEGLMMGTRSGDVDPTLASYLAQREGVPVDEVEDWLNTRSGLLGVSGRSRDTRDLLETEASGDARAALALDMFCYRVRKCLGAYMAALGGADAVVFGGGIGEHAAPLRARICDGMSWCGLELDARGNAEAVGVERRISKDGSRIEVYVLPVDEERIVARDAARCLQR